MTELLSHCKRVRFRTEKSLFFRRFAATFRVGDGAIPTLSALSNKGTYGLVF